MSNILRVAFPYDKPVSFYEPSNIRLAPEYIFLENTFSTLVLIDPEGNIVPGVAKSFEWLGDELHLEIREDLTTIDGHKITAEDAAFSLKRLLFLSQNTHGNLANILCDQDEVLESVDSSCSGIKILGSKLILLPRGPKQFLLPMLAAIDFAVIPRQSVDKDLAIKDYRNTTGPYYVKEDDGLGNIVLEANKKHFLFNDKMPSTVVLVPKLNNDALIAFKQGEVDLITTIDDIRPDKIIAFHQENSDSTLHSTLNIRVFCMGFTNRGFEELTLQQRMKLGKLMKMAFREYVEKRKGYKDTDQFFPVFGEGGLSYEKDMEIKAIFSDQMESVKLPDRVEIVLIRSGSKEDLEPIVQKYIPGAEIVESKKNNDDDQHLVHVVGPDTGYQEDISLLSYSIAIGDFGPDKKELNNWLASYQTIKLKEDRLKELQKKHFEVLSNGYIIPLTSSPYVALLRKPWSSSLSKFYANNQLWLIHKN